MKNVFNPYCFPYITIWQINIVHLTNVCNVILPNWYRAFWISFKRNFKFEISINRIHRIITIHVFNIWKSSISSVVVSYVNW